MIEDAFTTLTTTDLLNANVALIAGVLVLLTITIISKRENATIFIYAAYSPIFFTFSTGALFFGSLTGWSIPMVFWVAIGAFFFGLIYLVFAVIHIVKAIVK